MLPGIPARKLARYRSPLTAHRSPLTAHHGNTERGRDRWAGEGFPAAAPSHPDATLERVYRQRPSSDDTGHLSPVPRARYQGNTRTA
jgi:hypothetical protein